MIFTIDLLEVTQILSDITTIYQLSTLVEDLITIPNYYSNQFKITPILVDGAWTSISYQQKINTSFATALLNNDKGILEFRLMVEFPLLNKKASMKYCILNYEKTSNNIKFSP